MADGMVGWRLALTAIALGCVLVVGAVSSAPGQELLASPMDAVATIPGTQARNAAPPRGSGSPASGMPGDPKANRGKLMKMGTGFTGEEPPGLLEGVRWPEEEEPPGAPLIIQPLNGDEGGEDISEGGGEEGDEDGPAAPLQQGSDTSAAKDCKIIFAAFYAIKPGGYKRRRGQRCNGCHESPAHITFESARMTHPGACTAIITDMQSDFSRLPGLDKVQVHRFDAVNPESIGTENLMYERMKGYRAFMAKAEAEGWVANIVMLDTDVVIIGDVGELFSKTYDYGLTARANPDMPVNGGVQFVKAGKAGAAVKFLDHVITTWEGMSQNSRRGGFAFTGDQRAYGAAIGQVKEIFKYAGKRGGGVVTSPKGHKILIMPGTQYNRTPGGPGSALKRSGTKILHYKGGRKEKMYVPFNAMRKGGVGAVFKLKSVN